MPSDTSAQEQLAQQQLDAQAYRQEFASTFCARLRKAGFFEGLRLIAESQRLGLYSQAGRAADNQDIAYGASWLVWAFRWGIKVLAVGIIMIGLVGLLL